MDFKEQDIPLMKSIFNPSTHEMGMLAGGERAEEIFYYVCKEIYKGKILFYSNISYFYYKILCNDIFCEFFLDNSILQISLINADSIYWTLKFSPIAEKIWDSGKLNLHLLNKYELDYFKQKFESK